MFPNNIPLYKRGIKGDLSPLSFPFPLSLSRKSLPHLFSHKKSLNRVRKLEREQIPPTPFFPAYGIPLRGDKGG
ncbi:MAG: hypothetical protein A2048_08790 [Deltaproteobacteria bacterium GWA2_45_12]|nr:MAG: hypothetical protein A2048_08790 [Deltaproteobacteria bacterium GWA2_45_12]